jgi:hypothetical protein
MDYGVVCIQKQFIGSMDYEVRTPVDLEHNVEPTVFTLDNYHPDVDTT